MSDNGLSYLKAIGIRIHTVRYQKIRRRIVEKDESDDGGEVDQVTSVTSREYKRRRAAEERRKNLLVRQVKLAEQRNSSRVESIQGSPRECISDELPGY